MQSKNRTDAIKKVFISGSSEITVLIAYILICVVFSFLSKDFLTIKNFLNIGIYSAITGISAAAMTMILICGNIDISVGGVMGLSGMICSILLKSSGMSTFLTIVIALLTGVIVGLVNGLIVSKGKVVAMIATLATMQIFRGIAYLSNGGVSVVINNESFKWIGRGYVGPIPIIVIILLLFYAFIWYLSKFTAFGRKVYATGSNKRAAYLSGINVDFVIIIIFILNGLFAAISGTLMAAQSGAGLPTAGDGYEMTIISACVLGGTSLNGGKGSVWGTLIGVLLLTTISNGLTMLGISSFWQLIIKGIILLGAVLIDSWRSGSLIKA